MANHIKAFVVVIFLGVLCIVLMRMTMLNTKADNRLICAHARAWVGFTVIVFLAHSFWVYATLTAITAYLVGKRHSNPIALYFATIFAAPHFLMTLPGVGPIENFLDVTHVRILTVSILLPYSLYLSAGHQKGTGGEVPRYFDALVLLFIFWCIARFASEASVTMIFRFSIEMLIDIWIPYFAMSRGIRTLQAFRGVLTGAVLGILIVATVAVFESARSWLLYESLRDALGVPTVGQFFIPRMEGGPLRAIGPTTFPIILGYVVMIGLAFFAYLAPLCGAKRYRIAVWLCLIGGLIASFSRGPWVGAAAVALVIVCLGPNPSRRMISFLMMSIGSVVALSMTAKGQLILELLPFIGTAESDNVDYRTRLWDVSLAVFWQNPWVGDLQFLHNPLMEQMIQGQGIIDMVNRYLEIALPYGGIGLALFFFALFLPTLSALVLQRRIRTSAEMVEFERLGRCLIAGMFGALVTIATVAGIGAIPTMYWLLAGLLVAYRGTVHSALASSRYDKERYDAPPYLSSRRV